MSAGEITRLKSGDVVMLELGSTVRGVRGQVGWVAPASAASGLGGLFFVYDLARAEVATILDEKDYLHATRINGLDIAQRQGTSLEALLRWVFGLDGEVTLDPPLERVAG